MQPLLGALLFLKNINLVFVPKGKKIVDSFVSYLKKNVNHDFGINCEIVCLFEAP